MSVTVPYSTHILTPPHNLRRRRKLDYSCQSMISHGLPRISSCVGANRRAALAVMGVVKEEGTYVLTIESRRVVSVGGRILRWYMSEKVVGVPMKKNFSEWFGEVIRNVNRRVDAFEVD